MRKLLLLRPEPGLSASVRRAESLGLDAVCRPLFEVEPVAWQVPADTDFDALLLTSANAVRHSGPGISLLTRLPVHAIGEATAAAARSAGFDIASVGDGDVLDLLAGLPGSLRLLHLAGENHRDVGDKRVERRIVYRSVAIAEPNLPSLEGLVAAIHSPRAGQRLAELVSDRSTTSIAAISPAAAAACGQGWQRIESAAKPNDNSLLALAARLCQTLPPK